MWRYLEIIVFWCEKIVVVDILFMYGSLFGEREDGLLMML
jgi:hypothetical protein